MDSSITSSHYDNGEGSHKQSYASIDHNTALSYTQTPITSTLKTELASNGHSI